MLICLASKVSMHKMFSSTASETTESIEPHLLTEVSAAEA
jgi:hypothetical protein